MKEYESNIDNTISGLNSMDNTIAKLNSIDFNKFKTQPIPYTDVRTISTTEAMVIDLEKKYKDQELKIKEMQDQIESLSISIYDLECRLRHLFNTI